MKAVKQQAYKTDLSSAKTKQIIWVLLFLMPIVGMAVDLVAPSLPAIAKGLSVSNHFAKNVVAIYLFGYGIGNFITGFLSDAWGRRRLLRINLVLFIVTSLMPVLMPDITVLLLARAIQGLAIGAVAVLLRSVISDILETKELTTMGTTLATMWALGPIIGPVIGGYLQHFFGWKAGFVFFAIITMIMLIPTIIIVPETHYNRHPLNIKVISNNLSELLTHRLFLSLSILTGIVYAAIIAFNTLAPFLIQNTLHYNSIFFGHLALCLGIVFLATTFICRRLLKIYAFGSILFTVINALLILGLVLLILSFSFEKNIGLIAVASAMMFFACSSIFPMSMGKCMSLFQHISGAAGATMFLINISMTAFAGFIFSFIQVTQFHTLMIIYFIIIFCLAGVYWCFIRRYLQKN